MPKLKNILILALASFFIVFLFAACSESNYGTNPDDPGEDEVIISEKAVIFDSTNVSHPSINGSQYVFTVDGEMPEIETDDIVAGYTGNGYLRKVNNVSIDGNILTLQTEFASLSDVIQQGAFSKTLQLRITDNGQNINSDNALLMKPTFLAEGVSVDDTGLNLSGTTLYSGNIRGVNLDLVITDGNVNFEPNLDVYCDYRWIARLDEFHAIAEGDLEFNLDVALTVSNSIEHSDETLLASFSHPFHAFVGGFPVIGVAKLEFFAGFETSLGMQGSLSSGFDAEFNVRCGAEYKNESWSQVWEKNAEFIGHPMNWGAYAATNLKAYIKPQISIEFYSVAGPYLGADPYLEFIGIVREREREWNAELYGGLSGFVGFNIEIFGREVLDYNDHFASRFWLISSENGIIPVANSVTVNSVPSGAEIYFNGANAGFETSHTFEDVEPGRHHIRLYKVGFNEYNESFELVEGSSYTINASLTEPTPPLPVFEFSSPEDGEHFDDNVIEVEGRIHLEDPNGNEFPFENRYAVLTLNDVDQEILINNGRFTERISISQGSNKIKMRATSIAGNTDESDELTVYGDFSEPSIEVTLAWNTPTADLDLHIWNPEGEHCYYGNMHISDGSLDIDDVEGYGPETFTAQDAINGIYIVRINSYSLDNDEYSDANVQVRILGETYGNYGPHRFSAEDHNGDDPAAWWDVISFEVSPSMRIQFCEPPEWMLSIVQNDIRNLNEK